MKNIFNIEFIRILLIFFIGKVASDIMDVDQLRVMIVLFLSIIVFYGLLIFIFMVRLWLFKNLIDKIKKK